MNKIYVFILFFFTFLSAIGSNSFPLISGKHGVGIIAESFTSEFNDPYSKGKRFITAFILYPTTSHNKTQSISLSDLFPVNNAKNISEKFKPALVDMKNYLSENKIENSFNVENSIHTIKIFYGSVLKC